MQPNDNPPRPSIVMWRFMGWNALARDEYAEFARVAHCHTKRGALRRLRRTLRETRPSFQPADAHLFVRPKGQVP